MAGHSTLQQCKDWAAQLDGLWGSGTESFDRALTRDEELYFQQFGVQVPEGAPGVKTGSAPADADAAVDSLVPYDVQINVRPARAKKRYATQADLLTRVGHGLLHDWRTPVDILGLIAFDMVVRHVGVARVLFDQALFEPTPDDSLLAFDVDEDEPDEDGDTARDRAREDWQVRYRYYNPIICERRNPRYTKWRRTERGLLLCVTETYQITVAEAEATYVADGMRERIRFITAGRQKYESVNVQDIWVGPDRCILVNDQPIFGAGDDGVQPHGYPEIPYVIMPFRETAFESPSDRYRGIFSNSGGLYQAESQVMSMHMSQLAWNSWLTFYGFLGEGKPDVVIKPGEFLEVDQRKGHYIKRLEGPVVPPELAQTVGLLESMLQRNSVAGGSSASQGTRSAEQVWALQSQRQLKLEPGKGSLRQGVADMLRLSMMIIERFLTEPLTLPLPGKDRDGNPRGEVTVKPTDIQGYYNGFEVQFGRRLDPAMIEQAKALQVFATNNWMPLHESWRLSGLTDNPQEWEDLLLMQNIDRLPWVIELAALTMTKAYYGADSPEYMRLIERIEQGDAGGGGDQQQGAPGVPSPGGLEPPSGRPKASEMSGGGGNVQMGHEAPGGRLVGARTPPGVNGGTMPQQTRGGMGM